MEPPDDGEGQWEVVTAKPVNRGDADDGASEDVVARGPEDECRRVFADTVAVAAGEGYQYVVLRSGGQDVDSWPPLTGWTC
jgi:hypothetical protein